MSEKGITVWPPFKRSGTDITQRIAGDILNLTSYEKFSTGVAVVGTDYWIGRDADAPNQMHFNVPTGASWEWSVNDVPLIALSTAGVITAGTGLPLKFATDAAQEFVFNDTGIDVDFRVEGTGQANALFVQGSDGYVGIGMNTPTTPLEVAGAIRTTGIVSTQSTGNPLDMYGTTFRVDGTNDELRLGLNSHIGNMLIFTLKDNYSKDHDHALATNPTVYIHSATDPDTANDEWVSISHDQTDVQFASGSGIFKFDAGVTVIGAFSANVTNGSVFSASSNILRVSQSDDEFRFGLHDSTDRMLIFTDTANISKDHDHAVQTHPTVYINSATDPDTANDEWVSVTHDGTNAVFGLGSGSYSFPNGILNTSGGRIRNVTAVAAATYDLLVTDDILDVTYTVTAAVTSLTLPTAQMVAGRTIVIKDGGNAGTNNITIDTEGAEQIDGQDTAVISGDWDSLSITVNAAGTGWRII